MSDRLVLRFILFLMMTSNGDIETKGVRKMELSMKDRLILYNQYAILEKLCPEETYLANAKKIIECGYTLNYDWITLHLSLELPEERCGEVLDTLVMYRALNSTYRDLKDKEGIDEEKLKFRGFLELDQFNYCKFIIEDCQQYEEFKGDLRSQVPMLDLYREMLREWVKSSNKIKLTREDIIRITAVGHPPG